jgi:hypothetical protein
MKSLVMAGLLLLVLPAGAAGFYCGTSLVSEGDRLEDVLAKCGQPSAWQPGGQPFSLLGLGQPFSRPYVVSPGDTETLVYNCGEGTLIRALTFWNKKLTRIETAGHGFGPGRCP